MSSKQDVWTNAYRQNLSFGLNQNPRRWSQAVDEPKPAADKYNTVDVVKTHPEAEIVETAGEDVETGAVEET